MIFLVFFFFHVFLLFFFLFLFSFCMWACIHFFIFSFFHFFHFPLIYSFSFFRFFSFFHFSFLLFFHFSFFSSLFSFSFSSRPSRRQNPQKNVVKIRLSSLGGQVVTSGPPEGDFAFMFFHSLFLFLGDENLIFLGLDDFMSSYNISFQKKKNSLSRLGEYTFEASFPFFLMFSCFSFLFSFSYFFLFFFCFFLCICRF